MEVFIAVIVVGFVIYIGVAVIKGFELRGEREDFEKLCQEITDRENVRGSYTDDILLQIEEKDLSKIGYSPEYEGLYSLIKQPDNKLHFSFDGSPELELTELEYLPEYQNVTSGKVSGRSGSAAIGTLMLGSVGGSIAAAGSRNVNTVTKRQEIDSEGLLTFREVGSGNVFIIKIAMNKPIYTRLKSDFLKLN